MSYETPDDDVFTAFVKSHKEQKEAEQARFSTNSSSDYEYEEVKYVAAPKSGHAIVRFVGGVPLDEPNLERPTDAIERYVSKIKDDSGKVMYLTLPTREQDDSHLMWKIIDRVKEKVWINKKSVFKEELDHPEAYQIVAKGGFKPEDDTGSYKNYTWSTGWGGKRKLFINCIDRLDNWCVENKHTKIFSKNVSVVEKVDDKGNPSTVTYAERGVNSTNFLDQLIQNVEKYATSWERYDSFVMRVGTKEMPFKILNASKFKKYEDKTELDGITDDEWEKISIEDHLTDEERNFERYDLQKLYGVTSYRKIKTRLGKQIKKIDACLGTTYYDELTKLADIEAKDAEAEKAIKDEMKAKEASEAPIKEAAPAPRRTISEETVPEGFIPGLTPEKIALLKGWDGLKEEEKHKIVDIDLNPDGTLKEIIYSQDAAPTLPCPTEEGGCGFYSPSDFTSCPVCGKHYL